MAKNTLQGPARQNNKKPYRVRIGNWFRKHIIAISIIGTAASVFGVLIAPLIFVVQSWRSEVQELNTRLDQCSSEQEKFTAERDEEWTQRLETLEQKLEEQKQQTQEQLANVLAEAKRDRDADLGGMQIQIDGWIEHTLVRNICDALPSGRYNFREKTCSHSGDAELWISPVFRRY